jgi:pyrroline-5-carboxylate reductase
MGTTSARDRLQSMRIGFLGAGSIVEAMLAGIHSRQLLSSDRIHVANRSDDGRLQRLQERFGVRIMRDKKALVQSCDTLILAMKPKDAAEACTSLRGLVGPQQLVISVIAGVSTDLIASWLGVDCPIIRTMPNTSAAIGLSATGLAAGRHAGAEHLQIATLLFTSIGTVYPVPEQQLDIITGLSGSGPAYIYYLVEAMEGAGAKAGLHPQMARELTLQTLLGAAQMLLATREEPTVLRRKVTSPGGTTEAGLEVLESFRFREAVTSAILRAAERARELGEQYQHVGGGA